MTDLPHCSRRGALKTIGTAGALAFLGCGKLAFSAPAATSSRKLAGVIGARKDILERVLKTPMVDTHEHLPDESERLRPDGVKCDDWTLLFSHYLNSDLAVAGMSRKELDGFLSRDMAPLDKWALLAPHWPAVKNTGYGQSTRIAIKELYGVEELSTATISKVQAGYERIRRTGFYHQILKERAGLESCQVNCLGEPFKRSEDPVFLMQDISIVGMFAGPGLSQFGSPTGIDVKGLADWHRVIEWWFERYGKYAVAVKSQNAYGRDIDYARVPAENAEAVFMKVLQKEPVNAEERKLLEDHLFWYAVGQATRHELPVKLHTGYYAGQNGMPLDRVQRNAASASNLCRLSPETRFVFMHICYPYYEDILAVAKNYSNANIDMCWSWIISPIAAAEYLKKHIVTAPANKVLPFGGDYIPVEPVLGHAIIARRGIARALSELVDEGWLKLADAVELIEPILRGNAHRIFRLAEKTRVLGSVDWARTKTY